MIRWTRIAVVAIVLAIASASSCRSPTQIVLEIRTDVPCATVKERGVHIVVAATAEGLVRPYSSAETSSCDDGLVGTIVILPREDPDEVVFADVVGGLERNASVCVADPKRVGCINVRKRVVFIENRTLTIPVMLSRACAGVECPGETACENGLCVGGDVDAGAGCAAGRADCDRDRTNGCETGLLDDQRHCGACDHDCRGARCADGLCDTIKVMSIPNPTGVAEADDGRTYVASSGALFGCNTASCPSAPPRLYSPVMAPTVLVAAGPHLYSADESGFNRFLRSNLGSPELSSSIPTTVLAVTGQAAFFDDQIAMSIRRIPKSGIPSVAVTSIGAVPPSAMAADETFLFWSVVDTIFRCVLPVCTAGGEAAKAESGATIGGLAVAGTHFYWTETGASGGKVRRRRTDLAGNAETLTDATTTPRGIVVDGGFVYWLDRGLERFAGRVQRVAVSGGPVLLLAKDQEAPYAVAIGASRVVWSRGAQDGAVMAVAK